MNQVPKDADTPVAFWKRVGIVCLLVGMGILSVVLREIVCEWDRTDEIGCAAHRGYLDAMKAEIVLSDGLTNGAEVAWERMCEAIGDSGWKGATSCPAGGTYTLNPVGGSPVSCNVRGHKIVGP